jgi:hypothetical protein
MKWEYELAQGRFEALDDLQRELNALGGAGWEAIGLTQQSVESRDHVTVLLKRKRRPGRQLAHHSLSSR